MNKVLKKRKFRDVVKDFYNRIKPELLVTFLFVLSRLSHLGYDTFNTDVWKWKARIYNFSSGIFELELAQTLQKYHPGVILMWIGTAGVKVYNLWHELVRGVPPLDNHIRTVFELHFVQKFFMVLVLAAVMASIFYVLRRLFGYKYAVVAVVLLSLEPFYMALTRVLHLEGLMSTFMIASFLWLYYFLFDSTSMRRLYVSAFFASLAILTKSTAVFLVPFTLTMVFLWNMQTGIGFIKSFWSSVRCFSKWFVTALLVFIIMWPAMWVTPEDAISEMVRGVMSIGVDTGHEQFYFGMFTEDPGITYYPVVLGFRSSIYVWIGVIGLLFLFSRKLDKGRKNFATYLLIFALLYLIQLSIPSKKLDRYILPTLMSLVLVAGIFYEFISEKIIARLKTPRYCYIACSVFFLPAILTAISIHPDYFSFYNPLLGGLSRGINVIEPKWMIGQKQIQGYFRTLKAEEGFVDFPQGESLEQMLETGESENRLIVAFPEKYYTQVWPFIRDINAWAVINEIRGHAEIADCVVYPVWEDRSADETRFVIEYKDSIWVRGVEVYRVYVRR